MVTRAGSGHALPPIFVFLQKGKDMKDHSREGMDAGSLPSTPMTPSTPRSRVFIRRVLVTGHLSHPPHDLFLTVAVTNPMDIPASPRSPKWHMSDPKLLTRISM